MTDFSVSPYFDDYSEAKKFHKILFRPRFAVQGRELNQQQTILQEQIKRFGNHIFKNGSMVIPGQITYDANYHYVKMNSEVGVGSFVPSLFLGKKIVGSTSGVTADVIDYADRTNNDPDTLYVKYTNSGTDSETKTFIDGEIISRVDDPSITANVLGKICHCISFSCSYVL